MKDKIETALALREPEPLNGTLSPMYIPAANAEEERTHLRDYWKAVRKRLWLVLGLALLTTVVTTLVMLRRQNMYQAVARVQVDLENNNSALGASKNSSVLVSNQVNDPAYFNTQLQILAGQGLLRRAVKSLDLEHNSTFGANVNQRSFWRNFERLVGLGGKQSHRESLNNNSLPRVGSNEQLEEAERLSPYVDALQRDLDIEPVKESRLPNKETRLIEIAYTSRDPRLAAAIVNAIADAFAANNLEKKTKSGNTSSDFLNKRIAELQSQIRTGEEKLIAYGRDNEILSLEPTQNTVVDRLSGLNKQLLEAENDRKFAEAAYRAAEQPGAAAALARENAKHIDDAEQKLTDLQQRRAQLLVDATEEWPEVKEVDQQIATLAQKIDEMKATALATVITNLKTKYEQSLAREDSLRKSFDQQRGQTLTQNEAAINYHIIQQEIETNKNLLDGLLQRAKENDVAVAGTPNNINVVDYAIAPAESVGPQRLLTVALSALIAILFGVALAVFLEYLDNTVRSTDDVESLLGVPALAIIPSAAGIKRRKLPANTSPNGGSIDRPELLAHFYAQPALSESYRQLRTSILLSTPGRPPKTLLVTSGAPQEGKTTTSVNIAISLAQLSARVLIIDADLRRPRVHSILNLPNKKGLSTTLSRAITEEAVLGVIERDEDSGLSVLTSGPIPPNPAELLGSAAMKTLLETIEPHFEYIIIDSPPIAKVTDGVLLASTVDGVILVVHGGRSSRELVRGARKLLQTAGARVLGVVLNNVKSREMDYYYDNYYARRKDFEESMSSSPLPATN